MNLQNDEDDGFFWIFPALGKSHEPVVASLRIRSVEASRFAADFQVGKKFSGNVSCRYIFAGGAFGGGCDHRLPKTKIGVVRKTLNAQSNRLSGCKPFGPAFFPGNFKRFFHENRTDDSGGLQREAFFAGKQCVTVLDFVVWPETMVGNRNQLADHRAEDILKKLNAVQTIDPAYRPFGDGHAGERIVDLFI